jgi:hypothetical protein
VTTTPSLSHSLSLLTPKQSDSVPPPTVLLVPLPSPNTPFSESELVDQASSSSRGSPRSSNSHHKHPQSNSSELSPLPIGPGILRHLYNYSGSHGIAHILPVALCRKGEVWDEENLARLMSFGIRDILNIPCDSNGVGALYMVFSLLIELM